MGTVDVSTLRCVHALVARVYRSPPHSSLSLSSPSVPPNPHYSDAFRIYRTFYQVETLGCLNDEGAIERRSRDPFFSFSRAITRDMINILNVDEYAIIYKKNIRKKNFLRKIRFM